MTSETILPDTVIRWGDITIRLVLLTPQLALEIRDRNTHNRNLRKRLVTAYAADMQNGDWPFNGDAIRQALDGTLLDGQHRIESVIESGQPIVALLVEGLASPTQETMDTGARRNFSDVLKLRGEANYETLAGMLWRVTTWEMGGGTAHGSRVRPTNAQKLVTLEKYPALRGLAGPSKRVANQAGIAPSITGFCWWMFSSIDAEDASFFFDRLGDGQGLVEGDPIYELRRTLRVTSDDKLDNDRWLIAVIIKAWNAYREGKTIRQYKFAAGGAKPERFPEAH